MKFFILFALVAAASAIPLHGGLVNTGSSAVMRHDDGHGNYEFGYNEDHATGGTFRKESGSHGVKTGSYGLRDHDGRIRTVNYVADALGFRASVSTNEPGVDVKQDPAAINLNYGGHSAGHIPSPPLGHAEPIYSGHAQPLLAAPAPILSHGGYEAAAPLGHGAPLLADNYGHGEALVSFPSSYSVHTQHVSAGPILSHGAPLAHGGALLADNYGHGGY